MRLLAIPRPEKLMLRKMLTVFAQANTVVCS